MGGARRLELRFELGNPLVSPIALHKPSNRRFFLEWKAPRK
jgi:hypothetical protein